MNRMSSLDELTASELNKAIDDTNFPKARSTTCLSHGNCDESNANQNGKTNRTTSNGNEDNTIATDGNHSTESPSTNGIKGFIKRAHPAPLKMVAFKGDSIDVPGTPRTPRTSTTPGNVSPLKNKFFYSDGV